MDSRSRACRACHRPHILLVDREHRRRTLLSAAFRATGCHVIEVSTPLEAISELVEDQPDPWAIVIADTTPAAHADELRRFLRETYPELPIIDVGKGAGATRIDFDALVGPGAPPAVVRLGTMSVTQISSGARPRRWRPPQGS